MLMMCMPSKETAKVLYALSRSRDHGSRTVVPPLPDVRLHLLVAVLRANVRLRREEELDLLVGRGENGGQF